MATAPFLDKDGATVNIELPLSPARKTAALSRPVVLSNEDLAAIQAISTALAGIATAANQGTANASLTSILAKIIAAPATEAKQDSEIAILNAIGTLLTTQAGYLDGLEGLITATNAKDFATQTTLAAVLAKLIAAPATEAKQDAIVTALGGLGTQTTLADILAKLIAAPATEAKQDTANAALGATTGPAVITDANGTIQQYLRGLIAQWVAGTLKLAGQGVSSVVTITRPNDTAGYSLNDVVGASAAASAALQFQNMAPAAGGELLLTSVSLEIDSTGLISGEQSYRLYLYNAAPPSAIFDNGAWDLGATDRASFLGYIDLGLPIDLGSTLYVQSEIVNKQIKLSGSSLYGYLVTQGIYTPTAQRVYVITLHGAPV